jgi:hypothetical protein
MKKWLLLALFLVLTLAALSVSALGSVAFPPPPGPSPSLQLAEVPVLASGPVTKYYGDIVENGFTWLGTAGDRWDLGRCDLIVSYTLDMSGYVPPMEDEYNEWSLVGVGAPGLRGWMASGAPAAAETDPNDHDLDDKLCLSAHKRYDEKYYDAMDPTTVVTPPIGNPDLSYGIWFDRDGVDPSEAGMWGMIDGQTYNTGGIYEVAVTFHAIDPIVGTMFATVNGVQTGFYETPKDDQPDYYPVGKSITGTLNNSRPFAWLFGQDVKVYDLTVTGCPWAKVYVPILLKNR